MKRMSFPVGLYEVNCSVLSEGDRAWIVDPGSEPDRICAVLAEQNLTPAAILLTHAHFDHIGGIEGLQKAFPDLPVFVDTPDLTMFGHPLNQLEPDYPLAPKPANLSDLADLKTPFPLSVIKTPGHTPGGVCYYLPEAKTLLSGDTLFAGSVGRTDFPGGDMATLMTSLRTLKELPDDTLVIPGHGPFTTISAEKLTNAFLQ